MGTLQPRPYDAQLEARSGFESCCAEAQADGVPCSEIRDCALCSRAIRSPAPVRPGPATRS